MKRLARMTLPLLACLGLIAAFATAAAPPAVADSLPAVTGGAFVIGNESATFGSQVTLFWGAQWWKDNQPSYGTAPPAFKGYATTADTTNCVFTTSTGNSPPPPPGPLPAVTTVLVTNSVTQSGSTISGTITGFALVATNPGYASDPGHQGTGTVIGFTPCPLGL